MYTGDFTTKCEFQDGSYTVYTQAHAEEGEKIVAYNPMEMLALSVSACMLSMIGVAAKTHGFSVKDMYANPSIELQENPLRLAKLNVEIHIPAGDITEKHKRFITAAANACPVGLSIHEGVEKNVTYIYE